MLALVMLLFSSALFSQEDRKVLVEIFTNSHCSLCPTAHNIIDNYLAGPNGDKISYIYYHMVYPYSDDQLYIESMEDSDARDNYYNPVSSTPQGWFDGTHQGSSSGWAATLDNLVATQSPLKILLNGSRNTNQFFINAQLTRTDSIIDNDLVIHFVVVEDLYYDGRNSVSNHKHVMRKMVPTPSGQSFSINLNETKDIPQTITLDPLWDADSLNIVVFVQSAASKTIYQSETISYTDLTVTSVSDNDELPTEFVLEQNYPNPFNPSTKIKFSMPKSSFVTLEVFNALGEKVDVLVSGELQGGNYEFSFDAKGLTSGIYFYQLRTKGFVQTKKMLLVK
jgi:hypothetical protein